MGSRRTGVYPGTFDPVTNGHMDIISRATRVVDHLVVGVAVNAGKEPLFSLTERVEMLEQQVSRMTNGDGSRIEVVPFSQLLMNFVGDVGAKVILRGLRAVSDFDCCLCIRIELTLETNVRLTARFVPVIVLDLVMGMST